jgi:hypothetical protein
MIPVMMIPITAAIVKPLSPRANWSALVRLGLLGAEKKRESVWGCATAD